jgi:hypothetical protein
MMIIAILSVTEKVTPVYSMNITYVGPISMRTYTYPPTIRRGWSRDRRRYSKR